MSPKRRKELQNGYAFYFAAKCFNRDDLARPSGFDGISLFLVLIILFAIFILSVTVDSKLSYAINHHEAE